MGKRHIFDVLKRARKRSRCMVQGCPNRPIRSHSVSLASGLKPLARDGRIYRLDSDPATLRARAGRPDVRLHGMRHASTFYGFCQEHDAKLFRLIDREPFQNSTIQAGLHLLRTIAHERSKKEMSTAVAQFLTTEVGDPGWARDLELGSNWADFVMQEYQEKIQDSLEAGGKGLHFAAFVSSVTTPAVSSVVWFPDFDFEGKRIQYLPQFDHVPGLIGFFQLPSADGSCCIVAWHEDSTWCADRLLRSLARARPSGEIGDGLLQLQMAVAENVYFMPRWWESLPDLTREAYCDWWARQARVDVAPDPMQASQLCLEGLTWPVAHVVQR